MRYLRCLNELLKKLELFSSAECEIGSSAVLLEQIQQASKAEADALSKRIEQKKQEGYVLSSVEAHLFRNISRVRNGVFAPGIGETTLEIVRVFLRPLPIMIVLSIIIIAETSSSAWFPQSSSFVKVEEPNEVDFAALLLAESSQAKLAKSVETESDSPSDLPVSEAEERSSRLLAEEEKRQAEQLAAILARDIEPAPTQAPLPVQPANTASSMVNYRRGVELAPPRRPKPQKKVSVRQHTGLIEFISGVIAVYYPSINNPGEMAQDIVQISIQEGVDPLYVAALISVESSFKPHARSNMGALGLMQIKPSTAEDIVNKRPEAGHSLRLTDPGVNIRLGIIYLKELEQRYSGSRYLALAAYNWGLGNVDRAADYAQRLPRSVHSYATQILEKTVRWQKHFKQASDSAREFSTASERKQIASPTRKNTARSSPRKVWEEYENF